jgi:hypothetical protein
MAHILEMIRMGKLTPKGRIQKLANPHKTYFGMDADAE